VEPARTYARTHAGRFVEELKRFVRFPSVSADPARAADVHRCASWLAAHLRAVGLPFVRVVPTARHPVVYAEWCAAPDRPTVLVYGHYDVQPAGNAAGWHTPPFEPTVRGGHLFGRGASDDKGQLFCHVKAIESYLRTAGRLPVNVKCLFEGEEEIGSPNLTGFIRRHRRRLAADAAAVSDTAIPAPDRPALTYALRGGLALELEVTGPPRELHSGHFGGAVLNPIQALADILASLHRPDGRIAVPGVYDDVRRWSDTERERMRRDGPADAVILANAGVPRGWGEPGFTLHERATIRPALTFNGVSGGYAGPGNKSVIPPRAVAKLSFRLVPDQDPDRVERLFRAHVARVAPREVRVTVRRLSGAHPVVLDRGHPAFRAAARAYRDGFGAAPVFLRSGGSIPIVHTFRTVLGAPTVLMGFGLPTDHAHGPNERFALANFANGVAAAAAFLAHFRGATVGIVSAAASARGSAGRRLR
jgi:acetylornithine deacetylase/succinyl-diaminopimelate desuccinylase-like protein